MKTVYQHSEELAHLWANKLSTNARMPSRPGRGGGGKVTQAFIEGDHFYSYGHHYCIGRHLPGGYVAINASKNSNTTNRHVWEAINACRHLKVLQVFSPSHQPAKMETQVVVDELLDKASRAKANRPRYLAQAQRYIDDFNTFAKVLKVKDRIKAIDVEGWDAEAYKATVAKRGAEKIKAAKALRKQQLEAKAEQIAAWRGGHSNHVPHGLHTMLRLDLPRNMVETSRHAEIPVEDARRLWPVIQRVMRSKLDHNMAQPLGRYHLNLIRADGSIVVGCHDIPFEEIEGIAHELGLTDTSAAARAFKRRVKVPA